MDITYPVTSAAPTPTEATIPVIVVSPVTAAVPAAPMTAVPTTPKAQMVSPEMMEAVPTPTVVPAPTMEAVAPVPPGQIARHQRYVDVRTINVCIPIPKVQSMGCIPVWQTTGTGDGAQVARASSAFYMLVVFLYAIGFTNRPFSVRVQVEFFFCVWNVVIRCRLVVAYVMATVVFVRVPYFSLAILGGCNDAQ